MKVFKIYFLALLLIFVFPVIAQEKTGDDGVKPEGSASEEDADEEDGEEEEEEDENAAAVEEKTDEAKDEEAAPAEEKAAEVKPEEAKPAEEKTAEVKPEEAKPAEPEVKEEPKVAVKIEGESEDAEKSEEEKEKKNKKFNVSLRNGFSHGLSKERKSFVYNLTLGASYTLPWKIAMSASVGLNALYRYDMNSVVPMESGEMSTETVDYGKFDGTPLNIGLSKSFPLFWEIGGSLGINAGLPFTSTELWEQYNIYTILSVNLGLMRSFKIAKETSLMTGFSFDYTKTFAKDDYAWDDYDNSMLSPIAEHSMSLALSLALTYKEFTLAVGGGLNIDKLYSSSQVVFYPDEDNVKSGTEYQGWSYSFSFNVSASYKLKDWNFVIGAMTNAPESDSGNYAGYNAVAGDPNVDNGSVNYPLKAKYTRVFANIGYSYSF